MPSEFVPITTQEEFDERVKERLARYRTNSRRLIKTLRYQLAQAKAGCNCGARGQSRASERRSGRA